LITIGNPSNLFDGAMFMAFVKSQTKHAYDNGYNQIATCKKASLSG
jgi:hypothetical protein